MMPRSGRLVAELLIAFVLGAAILILPVVMDPTHRQYASAFLPVVRDCVEDLKPYSLLLLVGLGLVMGATFRSPVVLLSVASVAVFPLWSAIDTIVGKGEGHNLLPFEWLAYAFYGAFTLLGCGVGRATRRRVFTLS
jgi:hypothetical protein